VTGIAQRLKVDPAMLYRHFPGGRGALFSGFIDAAALIRAASNVAIFFSLMPFA